MLSKLHDWIFVTCHPVTPVTAVTRYINSQLGESVHYEVNNRHIQQGQGHDVGSSEARVVLPVHLLVYYVTTTESVSHRKYHVDNNKYNSPVEMEYTDRFGTEENPENNKHDVETVKSDGLEPQSWNRK